VPETPYYLVVGRGRWASLIHRVLQSERRQVAVFGETRIGVGESVGEYLKRVSRRPWNPAEHPLRGYVFRSGRGSRQCLLPLCLLV
jgi:hypothetical protein